MPIYFNAAMALVGGEVKEKEEKENNNNKRRRNGRNTSIIYNIINIYTYVYTEGEREE